MANVYSTLFIAAEGPDIGASYVVPAGHLAIVRDIAVLFIGAADDTAFVLIDSSTGTYIDYHLQTNPNEYHQWSGRQVVPALSTFTAASSGPGTVTARVSGYLLVTP